MVADTASWESSARIQAGATCPATDRALLCCNDNLGCVIPYEYMHVEHSYEPDFLVRLNVPGKEVTVILEVKGYADDRTQQKHQATQRWLAAVNTWGMLGTWDFHVCRNPQTLDTELMDVHQRWVSAPDHR